MPYEQAPVFKQVAEQNRTYVYSNGFKYKIEGVTEINISKSGHHRINCLNGEKFLVAPGWIVIELEMDHWSM